MAAPVSFFSQSLNDFSDEKSSWGVAIANQSAANVVAQQALLATLITATAAISLMASIKEETTFIRTLHAGAQPSNPLAQRENKWLVRYSGDATFKRFSVEIPGADLSLLSTAPQSDFMDPTSTEYTDFVSAFEAVVKSPDDPTESVTVINIQFVGRRL